MKNGVKDNFEQMNANAVERLQDKDADEHPKGQQPTADVNLSTLGGWNSHVKQKPSDSPKRTQSTVNSLIKSVFKIHGNNTAGEDVGAGKKQKPNGQVKANTKTATNEHEDTNQG